MGLHQTFVDFILEFRARHDCARALGSRMCGFHSAFDLYSTISWTRPVYVSFSQNVVFRSVSFILATGAASFFLFAVCYLLTDVLDLWNGAPFFYPGNFLKYLEDFDPNYRLINKVVLYRRERRVEREKQLRIYYDLSS